MSSRKNYADKCSVEASMNQQPESLPMLPQISSGDTIPDSNHLANPSSSSNLVQRPDDIRSHEINDTASVTNNEQPSQHQLCAGSHDGQNSTTANDEHSMSIPANEHSNQESQLPSLSRSDVTADGDQLVVQGDSHNHTSPCNTGAGQQLRTQSTSTPRGTLNTVETCSISPVVSPLESSDLAQRQTEAMSRNGSLHEKLNQLLTDVAVIKQAVTQLQERMDERSSRNQNDMELEDFHLPVDGSEQMETVNQLLMEKSKRHQLVCYLLLIIYYLFITVIDPATR